MSERTGLVPRTAPPSVHRWASIDDHLGPAALRFFGEGYRRTRPQLRGLAVTHEGTTSTLSAWGAITLPDDWSVKDGEHQRPHLATTDVIALTAQAVGALVAARFDPATAAASLVTDLEVHASDRPLEDDLGRFRVEATLETDADQGAGTRFRATVGPLSASGELARPLAVPSLADVVTPGESTVAPPGAPYGERMTTRSQGLTDVTLDAGTVRATSTLVDAPAPAAPRGLEAAAQPAYTLVDVFVATLQLGQVLLYDLDTIDRGASDTLWMRRTSVRTRASLPATDPVDVRATLDRARLVDRDAATWRLADVVGDVGPYTVRTAVAHRVPRPPAARRATGTTPAAPTQ